MASLRYDGTLRSRRAAIMRRSGSENRPASHLSSFVWQKRDVPLLNTTSAAASYVKFSPIRGAYFCAFIPGRFRGTPEPPRNAANRAIDQSIDPSSDCASLSTTARAIFPGARGHPRIFSSSLLSTCLKRWVLRAHDTRDERMCDVRLTVSVPRETFSDVETTLLRLSSECKNHMSGAR